MVYVIFYVGFLSVFVFISSLFGISTLNVDQQQLLDVPVSPPNPNLLESLTFVFNLVVFGISAFGFLATVNSSIQILTIFVFLPLSAGFLWAIIALARGGD